MIILTIDVMIGWCIIWFIHSVIVIVIIIIIIEIKVGV